MKNFLYSIVIVGLLGGCAGTLPGQQNPGTVLTTSCASAASGLKMLTVLKAQGKLSQEQISVVDGVVLSVDPICGSAVIPDLTTALNTLETQLLIMNGVIVQAGAN